MVTPVRYDVVLAGGTLAQNGDGRLEVFVRGDDNAVWHIWQTAPNKRVVRLCLPGRKHSGPDRPVLMGGHCAAPPIPE